jgi:hypothetical protein
MIILLPILTWNTDTCGTAVATTCKGIKMLLGVKSTHGHQIGSQSSEAANLTELSEERRRQTSSKTLFRKDHFNVVVNRHKIASIAREGWFVQCHSRTFNCTFER